MDPLSSTIRHAQSVLRAGVGVPDDRRGPARVEPAVRQPGLEVELRRRSGKVLAEFPSLKFRGCCLLSSINGKRLLAREKRAWSVLSLLNSLGHMHIYDLSSQLYTH